MARTGFPIATRLGWLAGGLASTLLLHPLPALAHPALNDRLVLLDRQIAESPDDARLYLSRGTLLLDERHPDDALEDFGRALALDPRLDEVHLLRSRAHLSLGEPPAALAEIDRFRALDPDSAAGWLQTARVQAALDRLADAVTSFDRFFALAAEAQPDLYLERASLVERAGDPRRAVAGLEQGVERLGPLTSLLERMVELQRGAGDSEAALSTVDRLVASSPIAERWLIERATILLDLDRRDEAGKALAEARTRLDQRPVGRRSTPALLAVRSDLDRLSRQLAEGNPQEASTP